MAENSAWYAAYTTSRAEKKVQERLTEAGIENYLPLKTECRIWSDRKKKISVSLISGYIFVNVTPQDFSTVLSTMGVVAFLKEEGSPVAIPDIQIERLRFVENNIAEPLEMVYEDISKGTLVEVVRGALLGFQGEMVEFKDKYRIVLRLDRLGCALVTVPLSCVKKIHSKQ